jgi:hypothetical protein
MKKNYLSHMTDDLYSDFLAGQWCGQEFVLIRQHYKFAQRYQRSHLTPT